MDFTPLRIKTIQPESEINFDLYIHFKDEYIKYRERGLAIPTDLYGKLKSQKHARFFINADDEDLYLQYLDSVLDNKLNDPNVSTGDKVDIAEGAAGTAVEQMQKNPASRAAFQLSEKSASSLRLIMTSNPDALLAVYDRSVDEKDIVIKHCINVCALSVKFAESIKLPNEDIDNLATAALLHDLGLGALDKNLLKKFMDTPNDLAASEKLAYFTHPEQAASILDDRPYINEGILALIRNHEENLSGTGPQKFSKLTKVVEILSLIDTYDKKITFHKLSPKEALKSVEIDEIGNFNLKLIGQLKNFLKSEGILAI